MPDIPVERITQIKSFPSLVRFLRDDLDWPLGSDEIDELVFEYEPDELGIDPRIAVKIKEIKQLRPLSADQPWGIFYISFEPKRLPVVVLRRVLQKLVIKKRQSSKSAHRNAWQLHDLLFISSYGEENQRAITFAHFSEDEESKLPMLRVIGWDSQDTPLHMDRCIHELQSLTFDEELTPDDWRQKWSKAFTLRHREVISTSKALASELAALATRIRQRVNKVLAVESEKGPIRQLYKAFQETLVHDLSEDDFADMYAQTITYGLFSTKKSRPAGLVAENLLDMIPRTNPFLKELLSTFLTVGGRKGKIDFDELGIDDVVQTLRNTDMDAVLRDFEDRNPLEDPVIHFYEGFLKEYDAKKKVKRGVFYTPRPVVSFIVRSVDEILRKDFGLEDGLADTTTWGEFIKRNKNIQIPKGVSEHDPFVQILDPAVGTGTFLVEIIDLIHKTMKSKWEKEGHLPLEFNKLWNEYIPKHLLPRLYGFELMMAPYAIAHMKIGLKLFETGYRFGSDERARIYLTNTLEEPKDISEYFEQVAPALAHEAQAANKVKQQIPTNIVIGNPPYAGFSSNHGEWITKHIEVYREIDGEPLSEKKIWLKNDYVKFIRYGQLQIEMSGTGILGYITDHSYLDSPTFRGARYNLQNTFSNSHILNLHGNSKRREKTPDGGKDENVFDITQGVTIGIFEKINNDNTHTTLYSDLWGLRHSKYQVLSTNNIKQIVWKQSKPKPPFYQFTPFVDSSEVEYVKYKKVNEVFLIGSNGIQTSRDNLVAAYSYEIIFNRFEWFHDQKTTVAKIKKDISVKDSSFWKLSKALSALRKDDKWKKKIQPYLYRPFDLLWLYASPNFVHRLRIKVMQHLTQPNRAICIGRAGLVISRNWDLLFCTNRVCDHNLFYRGSSLNLPLYIYPDPTMLNGTNSNWPKGKNGRVPNLSPEFVSDFASRINMTFISEDSGDMRETFGPRDVFNYIYGVFHSPSYRIRYAEFLKIDFPRIPIMSNPDLFRGLCNLGGELVSLHLMESDTLNSHITTFPISGDNVITKVGEKGRTLADVKNGKGKLFINKKQYFDGLPDEVWNFHIGGYQVCYKWLYDRKKAGRKLSQEDIVHYHKIVVAINETIKIMKQIDEVIDTHGGWPIK